MTSLCNVCNEIEYSTHLPLHCADAKRIMDYDNSNLLGPGCVTRFANRARQHQSLIGQTLHKISTLLAV